MTSAILGGYHMGLELECDISLEWGTGRIFWKGVRGLGSASPFPKKNSCALHLCAKHKAG